MKVSKQPKNRQRHPCQWLLENSCIKKAEQGKSLHWDCGEFLQYLPSCTFSKLQIRAMDWFLEKSLVYVTPRDVVSLLISVCLTSHTQLWQKNITLATFHIFLFSLLRWQSYLKLSPFFQLYNTIVCQVTGPKINHLRSRTEPLNSFY